MFFFNKNHYCSKADSAAEVTVNMKFIHMVSSHILDGEGHPVSATVDSMFTKQRNDYVVMVYSSFSQIFHVQFPIPQYQILSKPN